MKRTLIVNADDCNLTRGVTEAILEAHETGIVTSTTFLINLPTTANSIKAITRRKKLGVGLHLNVTLGRSVSAISSIPSLVGKDGIFVKNVGARSPRPFTEGGVTPPLRKSREIALEYQNQILLFQKLFGRRPTHLDTHHHLHDHPFFFEVLIEIAKRNRLPMRRCHLMIRHPERSEGSRDPSAALRPQDDGRDVRTTDYFFGNFTPEGYWREAALENLLVHLPSGVSEIMCHPGRVDRELRRISSFTKGREKEFRLFRSPQLKKQVEKLGIGLSHYGLCYT